MEKASFTHSKLVRQMRCDLSMLLAWVAESPEEDWVWMPRGTARAIPQNKGLLPPCRCLFEEDVLYQSISTPLHLTLWAPEPTLVRSFERITPLFPNGLLLPKEQTFPSFLFDRSQASFLLASMGDDFHSLLPFSCSSRDDLDRALLHFKASSQLVVKLPFSSSGRGVLLFHLPLAGKQEEQLYFLLNTHRQITLEPFLNKCGDYAAEYIVEADRSVRFVGLSHFETKDFRYLYNHVQHPDALWARLAHRVGEKSLEQAIVAHKAFIVNHIAPYYQGVVGIDMLAYRKEGSEREFLHPAVEINVRCTMGFLAHLLYERYGVPNRSYKMFIKSYSQAGMALREYSEAQNRNLMKANEKGALIEGTMFLSTPSENSRFFAYLETV